jgi:hypothetical protein
VVARWEVALVMAVAAEVAHAEPNGVENRVDFIMRTECYSPVVGRERTMAARLMSGPGPYRTSNVFEPASVFEGRADASKSMR